MTDIKRKTQRAASPTSHKFSKKLKRHPSIEIVIEQPSTPKARGLSPETTYPTISPVSTRSRKSSIRQTPQCPKTPPHRQATQDAVDDFSRASAKFRQSSRISLQIEDELSKKSGSSMADRAASTSSSKENKEELASMNHKLDRIVAILEELAESIPLFAK